MNIAEGNLMGKREILKDKSNENNIIANIAANMGYYHIAVSRNYYSLFQLIIYIFDELLIEEYLEMKLKYVSKNNSIGTHQIRIESIKKFIKENKEKYGIKPSEMHNVIKLGMMKKDRRESDYESKNILKNNYEKNNIIYCAVVRAFDRIIDYEEGL